MKAHLRIVKAQPEHNTIKVLRSLLHQAEAGELIGLAFTAMYKHREWACGTTGEADLNKAYTVGLLNVHSTALSTAVADEAVQRG